MEFTPDLGYLPPVSFLYNLVKATLEEEGRISIVEKFNEDLYVEDDQGRGYLVKVRRWHPGVLSQGEALARFGYQSEE